MDKSRLILRNISKTNKIFHEHVKNECERIGIPSSFHGIIFHIARENGLSQLELSKRLNLSKPTITLTLQKMESVGFIKRVQDESDQRITRVYLTDKGFEYDDKIKNVFKKIEDRMFKILDDKKQEELINILNLINNELYKLGDENETD